MGENDNFKMKVSEWRGEVHQILKRQTKDIDEIKTEVKEIHKSLWAFKLKVAGLAGGIAVGGSILTTFLAQYIINLLR